MSKKRSDIWLHFEVSADDIKKAKCNYCHQTLSISGGSVGNLSRHMQRLHCTIPIKRSVTNVVDVTPTPTEQNSEESNPAKRMRVEPSTSGASSASTGNEVFRTEPLQTTISTFFRSTKPAPISKCKELDTQLLKMIVKRYYPFSIVEDPEFIKLMSIAIPGYKVPCRKTLSQGLMQQTYDQTRRKIQEDLNSVEYVSVTTDSWTSINNENFTAITVHYLLEDDQSLKLKSHLIDCFSYNEKHTADNLAAILKSKFEEFEISNKIVCVVSDNAANILAAVRKGNWKSKGCFAHSLNLLVQNGLKEISSLLNKVKAIVTFFKQSSSAMAKLKQTQKQMGMDELKLKQDVITRWNSTFEMIQRAVSTKNALISTLALEQPNLNNISSAEWVILEKLVDLLEIFKDITEEISAEKNVTISKILVFVFAIYQQIQTHYTAKDVEPELKAVLEVFRDNFFRRFGNVEDVDILTESTVLDPRFKKFAFKDERKFNNTVSALRNKLTTLHNTMVPPPPDDQSPEESTNQEPQKRPTKLSMFWSTFDKNIDSLVQKKNHSAAAIIEFDRYLSEPPISRQDNPLEWWYERKHVYPTVYKYVKKRLCIPATSVPCERIFSKAGQILTEKRSQLKSKKLSQILFLNSNL